MLPKTALLSVLALGALVAMPLGAADEVLLGTEAKPELFGDGNVSYDPLSPGPKDHEYLALNRSWLDVDRDVENLILHLRVNSTQTLEAHFASWDILCNVNATLAADPKTPGAKIDWEMRYVQNAQEGVVRQNATTIREGTLRGPAGNARYLTTNFRIIAGTPGYLQWTVKKKDVLAYGTDVLNLAARCSDSARVAVLPSTIINDDNATSRSDFSLVSDQRVVGPDGQPDDIPSLASKLPPISHTTGEAPAKRSNGLAALPALVAIVVVAFVGARIRRRP